ncbi:alpha/beta fold hydrolase [Pseudochryseolinea flava]|uniref:Alpha/beta hydrolase n=1 Tax=Pseudochryseolinea flava TaxID=2059302 RepID=A0A364XUX4_9BACT|nr:alpha/beta hydrolase [Pseudochryseolinea flava]RAV97931.1 alpha/beta hydrolase [Pseudochryseolinea flava]
MKTKMNLAATILFLLSTIVSTYTYAQRIPAALGREEYIEVEPNVKLHVTDVGEGKPVVLIHGWPLSDAMFEYQYSALIDNGYRVIGITLRGFGKSDKPYGQYNYDVFADDIKYILDKLKIESATLGGFSMGGATVIHYAAKYKGAHINKLALFGAAAPVWTKRNDFPYGLWSTDDVNALIELNKTNRMQLLENFGQIFGASSTSVSPALAQWLSNINLQASPYAMQEALKALRDSDLREDLKKIQVPTLILHGKHDHICSYDLAEQMKIMIRHSELIPFEKSGHALFIEEREKFNSSLIGFIKK